MGGERINEDNKEEEEEDFDEKDDEKDDDEGWLKELEEEVHLDLVDPLALSSTAWSKGRKRHASERLSTRGVGELSMDILKIIFSFVRVGRVCCAWKEAMDSLARDKFKNNLINVLVPHCDKMAAPLARSMETELFEVCMRRVSKMYHQKARQLLFNLKDVRNWSLRSRLLEGNVSCHALVRMTAHEMANPQLVQQRKEWLQKRKFEVIRELPEVAGFTQTDMFTCRSCSCKRTRYRQWRRGAIVDRTRIIIVCMECTSRWEL